MTNSQFVSSDLSFIAAAVLTGRVSIISVSYHPQKAGVKCFSLSPGKEAYKLLLEYNSDQLKVSASQLSSKIAAIKNLPIALKGELR